MWLGGERGKKRPNLKIDKARANRVGMTWAWRRRGKADSVNKDFKAEKKLSNLADWNS